jgi:hypothetical protein
VDRRSTSATEKDSVDMTSAQLRQLAAYCLAKLKQWKDMTPKNDEEQEVRKEAVAYYEKFRKDLERGYRPILDDTFFHPGYGPELNDPHFEVTCPHCGISQMRWSVWGAWVQREHCRVCEEPLGEQNVTRAWKRADRRRDAARAAFRWAEKQAENAPAPTAP